MIWLDEQYIGLLSLHRLTQTQTRPTSVYNFRCPLCGDSKKSKFRARAYLYVKGGNFQFHCHNCQTTLRFEDFLKGQDEELYRRYLVEKLGARGRREVEVAVETPPEVHDVPDIFVPLKAAGPTHPIHRYVRQRKIPQSRWSELYVLDDLTEIEKVYPAYVGRFTEDGPRLVLPCRAATGRLIAFVMRSLDGARLRYITVRVDHVTPVVFGLDRVKVNQPILVVEGPIDSLFLSNAVAVAGADLKRVVEMFPKETTGYVFDNERENKDIVKAMRKCVDLGLRVCFWPETPGKDVNAMVLSGMTPQAVEAMINDSLASGLEASLRMMKWLSR